MEDTEIKWLDCMVGNHNGHNEGTMDTMYSQEKLPINRGN